MSKNLNEPFWKNNGKQIIGLALGLVGCFLCWGNHRFGILGHRALNGTPSLVTGLIAIAVMAVLYARKLIVFNSGPLKVIGFITDVVIFATFFALFFHSESILWGLIHVSFPRFLIVGTCVCVLLLLFGSKGLAKLSVFLWMSVWSILRFGVIEKALGTMGFVAALLIVVCLYLQENFRWSELVSNGKKLKGKVNVELNNTIDEASKDAKELGKKAASMAASAATGIPVDRMNQGK